MHAHSHAPWDRGLIRQLDDLAGVSLDGERLNHWVGKLLVEIIVDNDEANRRLDGAHITQTVTRLSTDGEAGRSQYVSLLKAMAEDDVQPLVVRQKQARPRRRRQRACPFIVRQIHVADCRGSDQREARRSQVRAERAPRE